MSKEYLESPYLTGNRIWDSVLGFVIAPIAVMMFWLLGTMVLMVIYHTLPRMAEIAYIGLFYTPLIAWILAFFLVRLLKRQSEAVGRSYQFTHLGYGLICMLYIVWVTFIKA